MIAKINNRFKSNRGDANSVSQILWIAIAAAVISVVGLAIFNATKYSGMSSAARLENLECLLKNGKPCTISPDNNDKYCSDFEKTGNNYVYTEEQENFRKRAIEMGIYSKDTPESVKYYCNGVNIDMDKGDKYVRKPD